jgi:hypothetical protein
MPVDLEAEFPVIMDAAIDNGLTPEEAMFLVGVRMTEQGKAGFEFGVKIAKNTNLRRQAGEAAASINKNRERYDKYIKAGGYPNYTKFFAYHGGPVGKGWSPIVDVPEWEKKMNSNWVKNHESFVAKGLSKWMPRVKEFYDTSEKEAIIAGKQTQAIK